MASDDIKEALRQAAVQIRDEKKAGANTALRVGSLLLAIIEALNLEPEELAKIFLRKDKDDRSIGKISSDKAVEVGEYVAGASGAIIYKDAETGQTVAELDKIFVRMKAYFETLEIINTNSIGGKQILSPAGAVTCMGVDVLDTCYRCYFLAEQDGTEVENRWRKDDQAYAKSFNVKTGVSENVSSQMYWRLVDAVSDEPVEYNGKMCHYIDLSITDCIAESDVPKKGDIINHRGNRTDIDRQNFVEMSSVDAFSPSVSLYHGVDGYSLEGKEMVQFGVDKTTGKAFMNVYGNMYVGARDESSFLRYTPEKGVELKCTLSVGTKLSDGRNLEDTLKNLSPEGYDELVINVEKLSGKVDEFGTDLESVKQQTDRQFTIWFFNYEPTLYNEPASNWNTPELKAEHDQDMFYYRDAGKAWRFENGKWKSITDQDTIRALELIAATRKEVDDMRYLKDALKSANPTVIENGLVMSSVVAVQNQDGEVEAFINGSEFAEDEDHGKLLMAGGIPEDGGTLEERSKKALTRIYEDGRIVSKSADIEGTIRVGTMIHRTLYAGGGDLTGYSMATGPQGGDFTFDLPAISDEDFIEVRVVWFGRSRLATSYHVRTTDNRFIVYKSGNDFISTTSLNVDPDIFYKFTSVRGEWYVSTETILTI